MLHQPTKWNLLMRLYAYNRKRLYCILMAVFFAVGILGNLAFGSPLMPDGSYTAAAQELVQEDGSLFAEELLPDADILPMGMSGRITAEKTLQGMDDFWTAPNAGSIGQNVYQGFKLVTVLPFEGECAQLFCCEHQRRRLWPGEKKIRLFHVVAFIHWTDGKKKSCFA